MTDNNTATEVGISPSLLSVDHQHTDNDNNRLDCLDNAHPPYNNNDALLDDARPATFGNSPGILAATNNVPLMVEAHSACGVPNDKNNAISPVVQDDFAAHNCAMSTAIADILVTPRCSSTTPTAATPTSVNLMALLKQSLSCNNYVLLALVCTENN
jgi:hypothetical protein